LRRTRSLSENSDLNFQTSSYTIAGDGMNRIKTQEEKYRSIESSQQDRIMFPIVGRLAVPGRPGEIMVEFNGSIPKVARLLSGLGRIELGKPENRGREVLLVFEEGDPERPIVVGLIENFLEDIVSMEINQHDSQKPKEALLDGKRLNLEAKEEIVLKCGKGSVKIRKDGKIVVKGTHILSRSSGPHRIKGGSVNIN
jgi:hypothetical protein